MKAYICDWCGSITPKPRLYRFYEFTYDKNSRIYKKKRKVHMCSHCYDYFKELVIIKSIEGEKLKNV